MKRSILAIGLAVAALALLGTLVLQSRPMPVDVHVAHHAAIADLERTAEDFHSLLAALNSAWASAQDPSAGARTLAARVVDSPERVAPKLFQISGGASQENRVLNRYDGYLMIVDEAGALIADLLSEQAVYAESVAFIRESGPQIIEEMRGTRMDRAAADTFQLVVGTLDYATADASVQEVELRRLLVSLGRDLRIEANMPSIGGREVLASIRSNIATAGLPVIILTGSGDEASEIELMECGADDYIRKPLEPSRFLARVGATLRRART